MCKLVRKEHVWYNKHFDVVLAKYVKNVELLHSSVDAKIHQDPPPRILQNMVHKGLASHWEHLRHLAQFRSFQVLQQDNARPLCHHISAVFCKLCW